MNAIQTAAKLYECRDAAKTLLGGNYRRDMELFATFIKGKASELECTELRAAMLMARDAGREGGNAGGMRAVVILAAVVEMIEPSESAKVWDRGGQRNENNEGDLVCN